MSDEREERKEAFMPFYFICKTKFSSSRLFENKHREQCPWGECALIRVRVVQCLLHVHVYTYVVKIEAGNPKAVDSVPLSCLGVGWCHNCSKETGRSLSTAQLVVKRQGLNCSCLSFLGQLRSKVQYHKK